MASPRFFRNLFALVLLVPVLGCGGPKVVPVSGIVRLGGKPLAGASVTFHPEGSGSPGVATTNAEGRYTLETGNVSGVFPGTYTVLVTQLLIPKTPIDERNPDAAALAPPRSAVPDKYARVETSPLKIKVPAEGPTAYDLDLK